MRKVFLSIGILCLILVVWMGSVGTLLFASITSLKQKNFTAAHVQAQVAEVLFVPVDHSLGRISANLDFVGRSIHLLNTSAALAATAQTYAPLAFAGDAAASQSVPTLQRQLSEWNNAFQPWISSYQRSSVGKSLIQQKFHSQLLNTALSRPDELKKLSQLGAEAFSSILTGHHRYIALLQNSDELRATGGFMGSYASIELNDGVIEKLDIQDIYQPDGQFTGFVESPPGVKEYLSGGKGLRLPDANWNPDFPLSAQQIMQFFAQGKETQVEGVIAVNLHVAEQIIAFIGPVYLPDYGQTVTSENLSSLARADRSQFFPGSQQKRQFLQALLVQVKYKLAEQLPRRGEEFAKLLITEAQRKHLQAYAREPKIEQLSEQLQITGQMLTHSAARYFFPVESNVGINKSNRLVKRQLNLILTPQISNLTFSYQNQNPVVSAQNERGDYINYQRIFVPSSYRVHLLVVNGISIGNWDENLITTAANEQLKQIGFLVTVPAQSSASAQIVFTHPEISNYSFVLQHQSGVGPIPYHVETPTKSADFLLEADTTLSLD